MNKTLKRSIWSRQKLALFARLVSLRDFYDRISHCHTGKQSCLSSKYLLFLDQSEKSPASGLATDEWSSNCIRRSFPPRKKKWTPDRRLKRIMQTVLLFLFHFQVFAGNTDQNNIVMHSLSPDVEARFVRFYPVTYKGWPCLRVEIFVLKLSHEICFHYQPNWQSG